jgi:hypothetical protein
VYEKTEVAVHSDSYFICLRSLHMCGLQKLGAKDDAIHDFRVILELHTLNFGT